MKPESPDISAVLSAERAKDIDHALQREARASVNSALAQLQASFEAAYPGVTAAGAPLALGAIGEWASHVSMDPTPSTADLGIARRVRIGTFELLPQRGQPDRFRTETGHVAGIDSAAVPFVQAIVNENPLRIPAMVPLIGSPIGNLIVAGEGAGSDQATALLSSIALRLVAAFRPGKVRFIGIDAVGLGQAFAPCSGLHETIRDARFWHEPKEIGAALTKLTDHVSMVIQKYLRNEHQDLEAFNRQAEEVAEPYRILMIARFPAGFSADLARQVVSLAKNGPRSGVHLLISWDLKAGLPYGFGHEAVSELNRMASVIRNGEWMNSPLGPITVALDQPPEPYIVKRLVDSVNPRVGDAERVEVPFQKFRPDQIWNGSSADGIEVPIGWHGAREPMSWRFGFEGTSHHALVCGRTGSGKTVLLHAFICGLALRYAPAELEFYLLDFKEGVAFEPYAKLPHTKVMAIEAEREFGLSVLRGLVKEMEERGRLFIEAHVEDLSSWRRVTGRTMPRIVLVIDEFQTLIARNDRLAVEARQLLDNPLTRKGRGFGVHVVLASQTLSTVDLESSTLSQIGVRIALQMSEADSLKVMGKDNDQAKYLERPGEAIYNPAGGLPARNSKFQAVLVSAEDVRSVIADLAGSAHASGFKHDPIVFEGRRAIEFLGNPDFLRLSAAARPQTAPRWCDLFLGAPTTVQRGHVRYRIRRQSRGNVLLLGQDSSAAAATVIASAASFACQLPPGHGRIRLVNLVNVDDPLYEAFDGFRDCGLPFVLGDRSDLQRHVAEMSKEFSARQELVGDVRQRLSSPPELLICFGLQFDRSLQKAASRPAAATVDLKRLVQDGPALGLHVMCWVDTWTNLLRILDIGDVAEFGGKIALRGGDSNKLLGAQAATASTPRANYALLVDDDDVEQIIKFHCYDLSSAPPLIATLGPTS